MVVIVGDDDSCSSTSSCEGLTEHLTWIGATVGLNPAELTIDKSAPAEPHVVGVQFSYTIAVENVGDVAASSVTMTDTVPDGLSIVSAAGIGWTCGVSGQDVSCTHDTVIDATNSAEDIELVVEVTSDVELVVSNEAQVGYVTSDGTQTATDGVSTSREPLVDLSVDKPCTVRADDSIEWTVAAIERRA